MHTTARRLLHFLFLAMSLTAAGNASATMIKLTFTGNYLHSPSDPETMMMGSYVNFDGSLPFTEASDGSAFSASVTIDTDTMTGNPSGPVMGYSNYLGDNGNVAFDTYANTAPTGANLNIFNNFDSYLLAPPLALYGPFIDLWMISFTLADSTWVHIEFLKGSLTTPDALDDAYFSVPDPSAFDHAYVMIRGNGTYDYMGAAIQSVTAQVVPVPAAAWLFSSALLGLFGLKRRI